MRSRHELMHAWGLIMAFFCLDTTHFERKLKAPRAHHLSEAADMMPYVAVINDSLIEL